MYNGYSPQQLCLMNQLQQLWAQHVYWTRFFIISTAEDLGDLAPVTDRILQNPKDFAQLFAPIFGMNIANQFQELLTQHLLIAADLVNAAKNGEPEKADIARKNGIKTRMKSPVFSSPSNRAGAKPNGRKCCIATCK